MSSEFRVRLARVSDAAPLASLAETTFRAAFEHDNRPDDMEAYVEEAFSTERLERELADRANLFLLASDADGGALIGYAKLRAGRPEPCVSGPQPVELERIYVIQEALGSGAGPALMEASLDEARRRGHRTIWLGVWEGNARALAFYERCGFRRVGSHTFQLGSDPQIDLVLELPIEPSVEGRLGR